MIKPFMSSGKGIHLDSVAFLLLLSLLSFAGIGCSSPGGHFINSQGQPLFEMDYLWEDVNEIFPDALPKRVKIVWVTGLHSSFMIDSNAVGIPSNMKSHIRRGKICRELTHLALHSLSGGNKKKKGRCFDNDITFLEQAIAGYIDRKAADILDTELEETRIQAAEMFRNDTLSIAELRDWNSFYYRGYWSDQYSQWNLEGLRILVTLGDHIERTLGLSALAPVFDGLADDKSLDQAFREVLGVRVDDLLKAWRDELLAFPTKEPEDSAESDATPGQENPPTQ